MSKQAGRMSQSANDFLEPFKPIIGTATDIGTNRPFNNGAASVSFTMSVDSPPATSYTVTSNPGNYTGSGSASPITVEGLQSANGYTFTVRATNAVGNSVPSDASNSITATTVPNTPNAPSLSNNGAETNSVSWAAPSGDGGKGITGYSLIDHENDTYSYNATTFSANVSENGNEAQTIRVRAQNDNGFSSYSSNSNQITTTPFSFSPFGFTPFGFTPFGFTPFGFTPFGFTPFGFTPFGFTPKSVGAETIVKSKVPEGLILAHNLSVGDVLYSANIEGIDVSNTAILEYLQNWSSNSANISQDVETTIVAMAARISQEGAVVINGNKYSKQHFVLIKRNNEIQFQPSAEVLETDLIFSPSESDWVAITDYKITDQRELLVSIDVEPYDVFFTDNALVHDSYRAIDDPNVLTSSDETFSDKLDAMYQQWRDSQDQQ
jgi:hypothetical protein